MFTLLLNAIYIAFVNLEACEALLVPVSYSWFQKKPTL